MAPLLKCDLDAIGPLSYPGTYPPYYLCDFCKKILHDLGRKQTKEQQVDFLCGVVDNLFRLGVSKGTAATRATVIANLFKEK